MFLHRNKMERDHNYEFLFRGRVRMAVWNGNRTEIKRLFSDLGAHEMLHSHSSQEARERMRSALREAMLEPNEAVQRDVFNNRFLID